MKHIKAFEKYTEESEHDIDSILDAYLECVIFTESGNTDDEADPFEDKTIYDFSNSSIIEARQQIEWFVDAAGESLDDISDYSIGQDIWYTRNAHGVGFWDRDYDSEIIDILEKLCKVLGYADSYVSNTGKIEIQTNSNYKTFDVGEFKYSHLDIYKSFNIEKYKLERNAKTYNL